MTNLTADQIRSIKNSYLNIIGLFLGEEDIRSRYLRCLLKWGLQLKITPDDLQHAKVDIAHLAFTHPQDKVEKVEALYHLVYMICMDQVVEDVELEVSAIYAERLGFNPTLISDLLKSIVTADGDGVPVNNVRQQVLEFLKLYEGEEGA